MEAGSIVQQILWVVFWLLIKVVPTGIILYGIYYLISIPLRRQERARLFIEILEKGLRQGKPPERTILEVSTCHDISLGPRFHLLGLRLKRGERFEDILGSMGYFLPAQVLAVLRVGIKTKNLERVLPATQKILCDANSKMKGAVNYFVLLCVSMVPIVVIILAVLNLMVLPKFIEISREMIGEVNTVLIALKNYGYIVNWLLGAVTLFSLSVVISYIGGERLKVILNVGGVPLLDWIEYRLPWRNKRLKRDFSIMLSILLDAELPEGESVRLAAESVSNQIFQDRAQLVINRLNAGEKMTEAIRHIDSAGEFRWRLKNATHIKEGFRAALRGWHEYLDAKAYQQEQSAAQVITTSFVLLNGLIIGLFAGGMFYTLIMIVDLVSD